MSKSIVFCLGIFLLATTVTATTSNVLDFGADRTGTNDSRAAIQAAIDAAAASAPYGVVYAPCGTYLLASAHPFRSDFIFDLEDNIVFRGDGDCTILKIGNNRGDHSIFRPVDGAAHKVQFHDFRVDGNVANNKMPDTEPPPSGQPARRLNNIVYIPAGNDIVIANVSATNMSGEHVFSIASGISTTGSSRVIIRNCRIESSDTGNCQLPTPNPSNGFLKDHSSIFVQADNVTIEGNVFTATTSSCWGSIATAIEIHGSTNVTATGNVISGYNLGFIPAAVITHMRNVTIVGNTVSDVQSGIRPFQNAALVVENLRIAQNTFTTRSAVYPIVDLSTGVTPTETTNALEVTVDGNTLDCTLPAALGGINGIGFALGRWRTIRILNNTVRNTFSYGVANGGNPFADDETRLEILGNRFIDCGRTDTGPPYNSAISLGGTNKLDELRVIDNRFVNTAAGTPTAIAFTGAAPLGQATITGNQTFNMGSQPDFRYSNGPQIDFIFVDHTGDASPESGMRGNPGSRWVDRSSGYNYTKMGSTNAYTGWVRTDSLHGSDSLDFSQLVANTCETETLTVSGAASGDLIVLGIPATLAEHNTTSTFTAWVTAADTVMVRRCVVTGDGTNPLAATVSARVQKQ